jgi:hypothetical protein
MFIEKLQRFVPFCGDKDMMPLLLQNAGREGCEDRIIINHDNRGHHPFTLLRTSALKRH